MSTFNFAPTIQSNGSRVTITAPHELKDKLWEMLKSVEAIVRRVPTRSDNDHTQIILEPLPGYNLRQTEVIAMVYTYTAQSPLPLAIFWQSSLKEHRTGIAALNTFGKSEVTRPPNSPMTLPDHLELESVLAIWLAYAAWQDIKRRVQRNRTGYSVYNAKNHAWALYSDALDAFRRLQFNTDLDRELWHSRVKTVDELVGKLLAYAQELGEAEKAIDAIRSDESQVEEAFKPRLSQLEDYPASKLHTDWQSAVQALDMDNVRLKAIVESIVEEPISDYFRQVMELTPVEPPAPIVNK